MVDASRRVLILVENLSVPLDRRVWQECLALRSVGYEVSVVCPMGEHYDTEPYACIDGVEIHRYPLTVAKGSVLGYVREYAEALWHTHRLASRLARPRAFAVVQACNPPDLLFLCALPHKLRGARFVFDHHDLVPELYLSRFGGRSPLYWLAVALERLTFKVADLVIATNESYRRVALERGRKRPHEVRVVRSAPDLTRFVPVQAEPALRRGRRHLLCYLGVMGPQDGVDYAIRALARLRDDLGWSDFHAVFIGSGDELSAMRALAAANDLDAHVEFTGRIPDADVCRYLSTADVCLAPDPKNPLNDVSTMNKILEYMAIGRPVVSFDLTEARVSAGEAALYAPPNDELEFARRIAELLGDEDQRERLGAIGRKRIETSLSWNHSRANYLDAYRQLLGTTVESLSAAAPGAAGGAPLNYSR